ncbi:gamma-glutamyl-gamma-aminobutyrate hydrolase family protein [Paraburkholderia ginsengisoli]|uniref:gamma-glutamyl-gamma-aminobutyrate hydrolase n=1 Tax=Paraburkholderia ginsengisoli TaxID=311231 RepID=A0A7T4N680_9BURK|nr:gamma-glutamyl-gamma-aminobutyrate hydrolase family protein [Paraburkholderia ginsengisoli]QQC65953.1 gamma-glutamyl-gamma-aminobutyrate hydrolase family protein [Paraburkholderia ginsengisoli]
MRNKPLVGISADRTMTGAHPSHVVGEKYIAAIVDGSQAFAMLLPALGERQSIDDVLATVDGLLFTGSYSNVEPQRYGGHPSAPGTLHDPARDATTLPLMRAALAAGVPVLAICRGFQELNVACGGSLHQSVHAVTGLNDHRENRHDDLDTQYAASHSIALTQGGLLQRLASGAKEARVNSLHGQGIERLGAGLAIEAIAPDGLIEAVSANHSRAFALGVQWHPEWKHADDALSTAIFRAFGDACRDRMRIRAGLGAAFASGAAMHVRAGHTH